MARLRTSPAYVAVLGAAVACYAALGTVLAVLPADVEARLRAGPTALGLAVGAPALTGVLCRPWGGRLADRHGPRIVMCAGAAVMAAAALPPVGLDTLPALLASRLAVGAGEGVMMSAAVLWLLREAGAERRGRALGHIGLANYAGLALGPALVAGLGGTVHVHAALALSAALPLAGAAAAAALPPPAPAERAGERGRPSRRLRLLAATGRAGVGLLLVNVGYVAVLAFGVAVARAHHLSIAGAVVAVYAGTIIFARTILASVPDRVGARPTLLVAVACEAGGLAVFAAGPPAPVAVAALVVLALGQALAVPALGLLALDGVPAVEHGAAAGTFFAWFDAGVGAGGPLVGVVANAAGAAGALFAAAGAVAVAAPVAARRQPSAPMAACAAATRAIGTR